MMNIKLATIFKAAQKIREESYDNVAAEAAYADCSAGRVAWVDYASFYGKTMREAAEEASTLHEEPAIAEIIYLLMVGYWNDAELWADDQLKPFGVCFDCSTRDSCGNERECWKEAFKP